MVRRWVLIVITAALLLISPPIVAEIASAFVDLEEVVENTNE